MAIRNHRTDDRPTDAVGTQEGVASSPHQPLRRPGNDVEMQDALHEARLADRGASVEDHLRDRDSKGVAGGYDDSIERDGAH